MTDLPYTLRYGDTHPPARMTEGAAGYDLTTDETAEIPARGTLKVTTGVSLALPPGTVGKVHIRSSIATKAGITLENQTGIIDNDYRGEIKLVLRNNSNIDAIIRRGTRVAQLVIQKVETPTPKKVGALLATERGAGGFGSTGRHSTPQGLKEAVTETHDTTITPSVRLGETLYFIECTCGWMAANHTRTTATYRAQKHMEESVE